VHNLRKIKICLLVLLIFLLLGFTRAVYANDVILNDLNGKLVNLSGLTGKPAILFFWTTWCPYCRKEIKALNQMYPGMEKEGITVLAIDIGESDFMIKRFIKDNLVSLKVLSDKEGLAVDKYEVMGVPTYIFLDKAGRVILQSHVLPQDYKSLILK